MSAVSQENVVGSKPYLIGPSGQ